MRWRRTALAAAALALLPAVAMADPFSAVALAVGALQTFGVITATTAFFLSVGVSVLGAAQQRRKARKAAAAQRAAYNAGLQDRTITALRGNPPWQIIYGRAIVGGAIVDIASSDKTNARKENGDTYTKADAYKHLVIVLAAHECEAIHEVYIDGEPVGTLDGSGQPTGGAFYKAAQSDSRTVEFTTSVTLPETPTGVLQAYSTTGTGVDAVHTAQTVTISGNTLNGPAGIPVTCDYTVGSGGAIVRIGKHLGTSTQAVDSYLASVLPSRYTSAHQLKGLCYIVVTLDLEESRFQGGPPNITAAVSGRKVYDPRTATTAWSANPALCIRDYLLAEWGYGAAAGEVDEAYVIAAADVCDELIDLDVGGTVTTGQPRYTLNGTCSTDASPEATLEDMAGAMAGVVAYGGSWQVMAGSWTAPVMDLTDDDLHGMIEVQQADTPVDSLFNGVRGQYMARDAQTPADFNPYRSATFATADGRDLWLDVSLPYTDNLARARNLCRVMMEANRSGQVLRYPATLRAWPLQVGDRVHVTSAEYGLSLKTYRVTDWQFGLDSAVNLTLQEDAESVYDLADAAVADPTPNTDLPNPWVVADMAGVAATSGGTTLLRLGDGTIVPRVLVTWTQRTDNYVTDGGRVEVLWRRPGGFDGWVTLAVPGINSEAYITGPNEGDPIVIEVRAVNNLGVRSKSEFLAHTVVGKSAAPTNVTGLAYAIKPGQVVVTWNACPDVDYKATELRYGGTDWASATLLWQGYGTEYQQARPANGTYTVRACHLDTSGNYSATPATISVTVDDSIDAVAPKTVIVFAYQRAASTPTLPSASATYTFATNSITGLNNGWSGTIPAGSNPLYVTTAVASGTGATDTIAAGEWAAAVVLAQDGTAGTTGASSAIVMIYQRTASNSAPTLPSTTATYTFATGGITGLNNGWSGTIPASGGGYLWTTRATALGTGSTDTIASGEWSAAVLLSQDGAAGAAGTAGAGARRAYALYTGNPTVTGTTVVTSGSSSLPSTTSWSPTSATAWTSTTQTPGTSQAMFQSDGVYDPATGNVTWQVPYLSNFKVGSLSAISADMGTITAGNIGTTGYIQAEGNTGVSLPDPTTLGSASRTVAIVGNTSAGSQIGVVGYSTNASMPGVYGYNGNTSGGPGVFAYGRTGLLGKPLGAGAGVQGEATATSGSIGVAGFGGGAGTFGVVGSTPFAGGGTAIKADATSGGTALQVIGTSTFSGQITSTLATGTAPFNVTSTTLVANLNAGQLQGATWVSPGAIGSTTPNTGAFTTLSTTGLASVSSLRINQGSSAGTAQWNLPNGGSTASGKPGANSTGVFVPLVMNGVSGWILWWPN